MSLTVNPTHYTPLAFATARALSPAITAQIAAQASSDSAGSVSAAVVRHLAYDKCITTGDLIAQISPNYRGVVGPLIREITDLAEKRGNANSSLRKLEAHKANGTIPSHLSLRVPELQACKEFREKGTLGSINSGIKTRVLEVEKGLLDEAIKAKKAEIELLRGKLSHAVLVDTFTSALRLRWTDVKADNQTPVFRYYKTVAGPEGPTKVASDLWDHTDMEVVDWRVHEAVLKEYADLQEDALPIALRAIAIVENAQTAMQAKIEKKKGVQKTADAMNVDDDNAAAKAVGEAGKAGPSVQSLVDKAVAGKVKALQAQVQKLSLGKTASKPGAKKSTSTPKAKPGASSTTKTSSAKKVEKKKVDKPKKKSAGPDKGKGKAKASN
ncbi:hypothetical protein C8Q73DRAFT_668006 [Cubamyces lactineus]|nr:hypothetical protein C8Q73DRAFT_668006 [Cubamyces lactineus]